MTQKQSIEDIFKTLRTLSDGTFKKKNDLLGILWYLYQRDPKIIPKCKSFASDFLLHLRTITENFDEISSKAQEFESVLIYPNMDEQEVQNNGLMLADLSSPQKAGIVNEYQNMLKEQLFSEQTKNQRFDYIEENNKWNGKIKNINMSINKCIEYAEKNL